MRCNQTNIEEKNLHVLSFDPADLINFPNKSESFFFTCASGIKKSKSHVSCMLRNVIFGSQFMQGNIVSCHFEGSSIQELRFDFVTKDTSFLASASSILINVAGASCKIFYATMKVIPGITLRTDFLPYDIQK